MAIRSLTARVLAVSTVWAVVALVVIGVVISALYRQGSERGFQDLLRAQLYNVINSISVDENAALAGSPQLGDLRFSQPQTGWYWIVEPIGEFATPPLLSTSLGSAKLPIVDRVFPLSQARDAYERLSRGQQLGKIVVEIG